MDGTLIGVSSIHPKRRSLYDKKAEVIALIAFVLIIVLIALICVSLQNKRDSGTADDTRTSAAPSESLEPTPEPTPTPLQFTTAPEGYFNDALFIGDSRHGGHSDDGDESTEQRSSRP